MALQRSGLSFIRQDADYTLVSQTAAQPAFNTTTNGRLTLPTGVFRVRGVLYLTNMSATSGNADFNILGGGGATLAGQLIEFFGRDGAANSAGAASGVSMAFGQNGVGADVMTASTAVQLMLGIQGMFKCTVAGTIVPSIALTTANAAIVKAGSHLIIEMAAPLGTNYVGAWD